MRKKKNRVSNLKKLLEMNRLNENLREPKIDKDLYPINVSGVNVVFNKDTSFLRRTYWGFALITGSILVWSNAGDRLKYFLSRPVSVDVQIINNKTLLLPAITMCPSTTKFDDIYDPMKVVEMYELNFPGKSITDFSKALDDLAELMDIKTMWDSMAWNAKELIDQCYLGRGKSCETVGTYTNIDTFLGSCITYQGNPIILAGSFHGVYLRLNYPFRNVTQFGSSYRATLAWSVLVHNFQEDPRIRMKTHSYYIGATWNKDISMFFRKFSTLNTEKKPCQETSDYYKDTCVAQCFYSDFVRRTNCRYPFMNATSRLCKGANEVREGYDIMTEMLIAGYWNPGDCQCPISCYMISYQYNGDTSEDRVDSMGRVKFYYEDMNYEDVQESYSYNFSSFVSDFGGMLGLLLGASILTAIEILEYLLQVIKHSLAVNRKEEPETKLFTIHENVLQNRDRMKGCHIKKSTLHS